MCALNRTKNGPDYSFQKNGSDVEIIKSFHGKKHFHGPGPNDQSSFLVITLVVITWYKSMFSWFFSEHGDGQLGLINHLPISIS